MGLAKKQLHRTDAWQVRVLGTTCCHLSSMHQGPAPCLFGLVPAAHLEITARLAEHATPLTRMRREMCQVSASVDKLVSARYSTAVSRKLLSSRYEHMYVSKFVKDLQAVVVHAQSAAADGNQAVCAACSSQLRPAQRGSPVRPQNGFILPEKVFELSVGEFKQQARVDGPVHGLQALQGHHC